ncbi:1-acyl-sn-glycerol-3-phosphate acyltransferase epsilon isoform X2 [Hyalella azteca]|uniref:1-acyl-sn-glycerol-3-phosphate acyltransferase epsilon isoform X2 n=1 Tax=Hyalella azteca TaxID=294128 RepID=A0A8B7P497_HYAAZ|nr:1-acyl-sn-glycerol-3-phosphate acyltransferase epsilon isoform X2 [Hyalella azteca]
MKKLIELYEYVRYGFGCAMLLGITPQYLGAWLVWRGITLPLPAWVYQWGDDHLYSMYQRLVLFFFETCTGVEVVMYGDSEDLLTKKETVLYFANHQSTVDWVVADMVSVRANSIGHLRYVMKNTLQLLPLYGWYFYTHGCIYVKRGCFNQGKMMQALDYLKHPKIPSWLIIFPEGTRFHPSTPSAIEKSKEFACKNNLTPLQHLLTPKHKGMWLAVEHLHSKLDALYDVSVFYEGSVDTRTGERRDAPQLVDFLLGRCSRVHIKVRRIPISQVPKTEEKFKTWLHETFVEKDALLRPFFTGVIDSSCELASRNESQVDRTNSFSSTQELDAQNVLRTSKSGSLYPDLDSDNVVNGDVSFKYNYNRLSRQCGGVTSPLSLWATVPSFLVFGASCVVMAWSPWTRRLFWSLLGYGTLGTYAWLAVRNVC